MVGIPVSTTSTGPGHVTTLLEVLSHLSTVLLLHRIYMQASNITPVAPPPTLPPVALALPPTLPSSIHQLLTALKQGT